MNKGELKGYTYIPTFYLFRFKIFLNKSIFKKKENYPSFLSKHNLVKKTISCFLSTVIPFLNIFNL